MSAFFSIFITVFLAELGDKTQIATALFAAEGERSRLMVFLASSTALVASAGLATIVGSVAREFFEGPLLKLIAGGGFIVIGVWVVWSALRPS
jgi:putative Ca2+/H+ antiporter (TMEM165/GDT1 family)